MTAGAAAVPRPEPVHLGASSPRVVRPGREFTARFVAYPPADEAEVHALLTNLGPGQSPQLGQAVGHWKHGTRVEVRVRGDSFVVEDSVRTFTWEGERVLEAFDVRVAADAPAGPSVLKFDVAIEGIIVARLRIHPEIGPTPSKDFVHATTEAARRAFASYASADRQRVLDRVAAAQISAGLDVFMDCLSLHPGEKWKPELEREITERELFLLFWSAAARQSPWVEWEWRLALRKKSIEAFQLHPLETVAKAPPPDELRELHFGDIAMTARQAGD